MRTEGEVHLILDLFEVEKFKEFLEINLTTNHVYEDAVVETIARNILKRLPVPPKEGE